MYFVYDCFCYLGRFKDHVQSNNPKHFLSEEEFVPLRVELSKANTVATADEDEETPSVEEDLPPGTEDLPDPAKVCPLPLPRSGMYTNIPAAGFSRRLPFPPWRKREREKSVQV